MEICDVEKDVDDSISAILVREAWQSDVKLACGECSRVESAWELITVDPACNITDLKP